MLAGLYGERCKLIGLLATSEGFIIRQIINRAIIVAVIAVVIGAVWAADLRWGAHAAGIRLLDIEPFVFIENKLSGEQIRYNAVQARLAADQVSSIADMDAYAERLFADQLRGMAERDGKTV